MSETVTIPEPRFEKGVISGISLNDVQMAMMDRMVYNIIVPIIALGHMETNCSRDAFRRDFRRHVSERVNDYSSYIAMFGGFHYYSQLLLENVIAALREVYDAPKKLLDELEEMV